MVFSYLQKYTLSVSICTNINVMAGPKTNLW